MIKLEVKPEITIRIIRELVIKEQFRYLTGPQPPPAALPLPHHDPAGGPAEAALHRHHHQPGQPHGGPEECSQQEELSAGRHPHQAGRHLRSLASSDAAG